MSSQKYEYYLIDNVRPVRFKYIDNNLICAESPDPVTRRVEINNPLIARVNFGDRVEEVDEKTFERHCEIVYENYAPDKLRIKEGP